MSMYLGTHSEDASEDLGGCLVGDDVCGSVDIEIETEEKEFDHHGDNSRDYLERVNNGEGGPIKTNEKNEEGAVAKQDKFHQSGLESFIKEREFGED